MFLPGAQQASRRAPATHPPHAIPLTRRCQTPVALDSLALQYGPKATRMQSSAFAADPEGSLLSSKAERSMRDGRSGQVERNIGTLVPPATSSLESNPDTKPHSVRCVKTFDTLSGSTFPLLTHPFPYEATRETDHCGSLHQLTHTNNFHIRETLDQSPAASNGECP